ncbi:MAG: APC family permease [Actinomycetes bacterium]
MPAVGDVLKRLILGRALSSDRAGEQLLPKRLALPIFASDPLSSVAYATQEIFVVLTVGGISFLYLTPWLAGAVVLLLITVVLSYRQLVHAYPTGGGDYEVSSKNISPVAGVTVASALLVDYVMTVAVSVSSGVDNIISAATGLASHRELIAVGFVVLLTAANLRGLKESGKTFAVPTYAFAAGMLIMIVVGLGRVALGHHLVAESAGYPIKPTETGIAGLGLVFLALRAFASGCTALTGVEAIANGVPAFREPKSKNAATTLAAMGLLAMSMFVGVTALAMVSHVHYVDPDHVCNLIGFNCQGGSAPQRTVIAQVAAAVFGGTQNFFFYFIQAATALILILAANTAFNGFPLLGSVLAQDRYLPRQLHTRGDRLVFSNGVLILAAVAIGLILAFHANTSKLINLYILGVFTSFTLGQTGMVRHWNRLIPQQTSPQAKNRMRRARLINGFGATFTGLVLVIVTITKFTKGAYLVVIAMPILFVMMRGIHRHYTRVAQELEPDFDEETVLPSRTHAIVLVSKLHKPTLRAIAYARATRPSILEAVTVGVDKSDTQALQAEWFHRKIPVELKVLASPYREITKPVLDYVKSIRRKSPRDVVTVFVPEYVVGHWWENLLHNQSALRLKTRLLFTPGVMVTSVPWQLASSDRRATERDPRGPGSLGQPQEPSDAA